MNIAKSITPEANGGNKSPFLTLVVYQKKISPISFSRVKVEIQTNHKGTTKIYIAFIFLWLTESSGK